MIQLPLAVLSMNATNECRMARIDEFNDKRRLYCIKVRMMMTYIKGLTLYLRSEQTTQTLGASWVAIGSASIWVCLGTGSALELLSTLGKV